MSTKDEKKLSILNHCQESIAPLISSYYDKYITKDSILENEIIKVIEALAKETESEILTEKEIASIKKILFEIDNLYHKMQKEFNRESLLKIAWLEKIIYDNHLHIKEEQVKVFASYHNLFILIHLVSNYYDEIMPLFENKWSLFILIIKRSITAKQPLNEEEKMRLLLIFLNNNLDKCSAIHNLLINHFYQNTFNKEIINDLDSHNEAFKLIHQNQDYIIKKVDNN